MECDERHGQTVETYSADRISLLRDRSSYLAHRRKLLDVGTAERVAVVHSLRMGLRVINRDRAEVSSPLSPSDLRGIEATVRTVQFSTPLSDNDHQRLGAWFLDKSNVGLRAYGSASASVDYLRHYPRLHSFDIDCGHPLADIAGLKLLPANLRGLGLDVRLPKGSDLSSLTRLEKLDRLSLSTHRRLPAVVSALTTLRTLHLVGPIDDIAVVADLRSLESLTLRSTKVDLEPVSTLPGLRKLALKLGGGVDLGALSSLSSLEYLELWLIRGLADMSFRKPHRSAGAFSAGPEKRGEVAGPESQYRTEYCAARDHEGLDGPELPLDGPQPGQLEPGRFGASEPGRSAATKGATQRRGRPYWTRKYPQEQGAAGTVAAARLLRAPGVCNPS